MPGEPGEAGHAVDEGADAGQHDTIRPGERRRIGRHLDPGPAGGFGGGALEGLGRRTQIPRSVIYDGDGHGTAPALAGKRPDGKVAGLPFEEPAGRVFRVAPGDHRDKPAPAAFERPAAPVVRCPADECRQRETAENGPWRRSPP